MKKRMRLFGYAGIGIFFLFSVLSFGRPLHAGSVTPPDGAPSAKFYTLSEIYEFITNNTTATEGSHDFGFSSILAGTGRTLSEIYAALSGLISADQVKKDTTYLGVTGTLVPSGGTASAGDIFNGKTAHLTDDWALDAGTLNLACNTGTFNGTSNKVADLYDGSGNGSNRWCITSSGDATTVDLGLGKKAWVDGEEVTGTYDTSNLSASNVRYGTTYGASGTGTFSPYPNAPSGISGLNQSVCSGASWIWVADSDYDGVNDDPICVSSRAQGSSTTKLWNMSGVAPYNVTDNTFIGNYGCSGDSDGNGVGTLNGTLSGTVSENANFGDDADTALAIADCKDGIRNLLTAAYVESFGYTQPNVTDLTVGYNGPLTPKDLFEWKGTRLPSSNDFFGFCGDGTSSKTAGSYGVQIGRTDSVSGTASQGSYEWLSEQPYNTVARIAGSNACSYFTSSTVTTSYRFRAVFRP